MSNETIDQATRSLNLIQTGDISEVPPYMDSAEWEEHNALIVDAEAHPELQHCPDCNQYHKVLPL